MPIIRRNNCDTWYLLFCIDDWYAGWNFTHTSHIQINRINETGRNRRVTAKRENHVKTQYPMGKKQRQPT
jgi:hypothetical protein